MKNKSYSRKRKPIIALILEGRNETERTFFTHFKTRDKNIRIYNCEAPDPKNMIKKAKQVINDDQLDSSLGDRLFCLIDLDLSKQKEQIINDEKNRKNSKCKIEFILSNPCFEVWLLYYFIANPKVENSSQKVKEQLIKKVPLYSESYDIIDRCDLYNKHDIAIKNSSNKNKNYSDDTLVVNKNPYTEVHELIKILLS